MAGHGEAAAEERFELTGGALCLDFVNTLGDRPRCREEQLHDPADLVAWAEQAGVLAGREVSATRRWVRREPDAARKALKRAIALRESLYRVFGASACGSRPPARDLAAFNEAIAGSYARLRLACGTEGYDWQWERCAPSLDRVMWPVIRSAADLLTSGECIDVRKCCSDTCSWLFVDRSRTKKRRWCSMQTCGNRDKVRRFYERRRRAKRS